MSIKINEIPPEGLTVTQDRKIDLFDRGTASTALTAELSIKPGPGGALRITGRIRSALELECSRCLEPFSYPVDAEVLVDLAPVSSLGTETEHELSGGELDTEFYEGEEFDADEFVKEQLLITVPMVPLHSPDCKGLCGVCGQDLNKKECGHPRSTPEAFGPFAALKDLLKKQ